MENKQKGVFQTNNNKEEDEGEETTPPKTSQSIDTKQEIPKTTIAPTIYTTLTIVCHTTREFILAIPV